MQHLGQWETITTFPRRRAAERILTGSISSSTSLNNVAKRTGDSKDAIVYGFISFIIADSGFPGHHPARSTHWAARTRCRPSCLAYPQTNLSFPVPVSSSPTCTTLSTSTPVPVGFVTSDMLVADAVILGHSHVCHRSALCADTYDHGLEHPVCLHRRYVMLVLSIVVTLTASID